MTSEILDVRITLSKSGVGGSAADDERRCLGVPGRTGWCARWKYGSDGPRRDSIRFVRFPTFDRARAGVLLGSMEDGTQTILRRVPRGWWPLPVVVSSGAVER